MTETKPPRDSGARKDMIRTREQQHTGNHPEEVGEVDRPYGADTFGGTRAGAENVEPTRKKSGPKPAARH